MLVVLKSTAHAALVAQIWARVKDVLRASGRDSDCGPSAGLYAEAARLSYYFPLYIYHQRSRFVIHYLHLS